MADTDPSDRPQKRVRLDDSASASATPAINTESSATPTALATTSDSATPAEVLTNEAADLEKEVRAGITEYVCPDNLGFTGVLKRRYTDFLVNEIGLDGQVLHLKSVGLPDKKGGQKREEKKDDEMKEAPVKEKKMEEKKDEEVEEDVPELVVSDEDVAALKTIFGEETTAKVVTLAKSIRKHPNWKAKDFTAIIAAPIPDKELRTSAHQTLRRVFPNMLESAMEQDQSIRIKAAPPAQRSNKRKQAAEAKSNANPDRKRGQLAWEEQGGEYLHFSLYKENKDTMEVIGFLGSVTGGGAKSFGFAGTKDRRACTVQRVSVKRQSAERIAGIGRNLYNAAIGDFEYKKHDLSLGDLIGNEFTITLRDCHFEKEEGLDFSQRLQLANEVLAQAVKDFSVKGFINYYGLQRFGTFANSTDAIGVKLLQGNYKGAVDDLLAYSEVALAAAQSTEENPKINISSDDKARAQALHVWKTDRNGHQALDLLPRKFYAERNIIQHLSSRNSRTKKHDRTEDYQGALMTIPRNLRLMYVHAYQSLVWNVVAGKRWTTYGDKVVEGDLVLVHEHKDKESGPAPAPLETVDQDGEYIINPTGADSSNSAADDFERARPLTAEEAASGKYTIFDIVLPQPGFDVEYPGNAMGDFIKEFMGSERGGKLDPNNMRRSWREISLSGGYRKFLARPLQPISFEVKEYTDEEKELTVTDLQALKNSGVEIPAPPPREVPSFEKKVVKREGGEERKIAVCLKLQLGSSQYATMALRELMKAGGVRAFRPEFMGGR